MSLVEHTPKPAPFLAGGSVKAIIPQSFEEVYRLARIVVAAGMAPKGMDTEEKAAIAIMRGLEVGLTPFQALDKIAIVNGRPVIWGDGALALVRGSGLCEWIDEGITDAKGDERAAHCSAKRRGDPKVILRHFSVGDAKKAGLWGKQGPWQQYPDRMLQMRARAFCLRDGFADVLGGLYLKEEFDGIIDGQARDVTPTPPVPPPPPVSVVRKQLEASVAQIEAQGFDWEAYRKSLQACDDQAAMNAIFEAAIVGLSEDEIEECQSLLTEEAARFWREP